ncbi:RES domain-containing protein [Novosphingobium sp.]|uniref:RES family NAD+ phosphorylase n=1 Tax=Novosphingobium sp. TaxID=1874826 RepID=UPI001D3E611F|nr:RES domain-containing protein [Novosphingobium sp.]MBX9663074.1 RES domain-containing protein [Novosphingobium sp.]
MRLWRITRAAHVALDGAGAIAHGGRYSPPGMPVVHFASEAGLAVLIALRYQPADPVEAANDTVLGWIEVAEEPERVPPGLDEPAIRAWVESWLVEQRSLVAAVPSKVLPEGDVLLFNPRHPGAAHVGALQTRPFSFAECLHAPPMRIIYEGLR